MTAAGAGAVLRASPRRPAALHLLVHLAMLAAMLGAMAPPAGGIRHLVAGLALVVLSLGMAPWARRSREVLDAIVDLWATAAILLAPALSPAQPATIGAHQHGGASAQVIVVLVLLGWAAARVRPGPPRRWVWMLVSGAGLLAMVITDLALA
jgi:hypothetical protein